MKILIVEDEEMIREGISDYLTDCGYETIEATDGEEALEKFSKSEKRIKSGVQKLDSMRFIMEIFTFFLPNTRKKSL